MQSGNPGLAMVGGERYISVGASVPATFRLPRLQERPANFHVAVADPHFVGVDPGVLDVPQGLLDKIRAAKSVLVVAHAQPDIDCVGSALSLNATLRLLGKQVDVCIDDQLGINGGKLDMHGTIQRAHALADKTWDLAIVVDVGNSNRINGAGGLLKSANDVLVIDHHPESHRDDIRKHFRSNDSWVDGSLNASALQVTAIASRLLAGRSLTIPQLRAIWRPALAGMCTDTKFGAHDSVEAITPAIFKYGLAATGLSIDAITQSFDVAIPKYFTDIVDDTRNFKVVQTDRIKMLVASADAYKRLKTEFRKEFPTATDRDVTDVMRTVMNSWFANGHSLCAIVAELGSGILVAPRSRNGAAGALARKLGGAGHDSAAAATIYGTTLDEVVKRVIQAA